MCNVTNSKVTVIFLVVTENNCGSLRVVGITGFSIFFDSGYVLACV